MFTIALIFFCFADLEIRRVEDFANYTRKVRQTQGYSDSKTLGHDCVLTSSQYESSNWLQVGFIYNNNTYICVYGIYVRNTLADVMILSKQMGIMV